MSRRLTHHDEEKTKRRQLFWLSTSSSVLIVVLWIFYMQASFGAGRTEAGKKIETTFNKGIAVIGETIETGLVNSYLYFHTVASEEKTFTITPR
jgi:hypothetical protein